jgi:hypothetical protein
MRVPLYSALKMLLPASVSLKTASTTDSSVAVVSRPQNALQSLATKPLATTSLPLLTVPAHNGIYKRVESSSISATLHIG